jgi:hypothetical protein
VLRARSSDMSRVVKCLRWKPLRVYRMIQMDYYSLLFLVLERLRTAMRFTLRSRAGRSSAM